MVANLFVAAERSWRRIDGHDQLLKLGRFGAYSGLAARRAIMPPDSIAPDDSP